MSKKNGTAKFVRKLGEREEDVIVTLSDREVQAERKAAIDMMMKIEELKEKKKKNADEFSRNIKSFKADLEDTLEVIDNGSREEKIVVEDWLLSNNEVIRIRQDTREQVGPPRTATASELQEELPLSDPGEPEGQMPEPDPSTSEPEAEFPAFGEE